MRFFKYLVLIFASIISVDALAAIVYTIKYGNDTYVGSTSLAACENFASGYSSRNNASAVVSKTSENMCELGGKSAGGYGLRVVVDVSKSNQCPAKYTPLVVWLTKGSTHIPIRLCKDGCTYTGVGNVTEMTNYDNTILQATGDAVNCSNEYKDDPPPKCDKTDPYGECYVPPDDKCVRAKDGSIFCPDNSKPPENNTCNGADYCKRPPEGCGPGYVPGSFNGQQLCVRSGPNVPKDPPEPDKPDDPNNCMNGGSYCPQPPNNTSCPSGYYETTYNGSKICVKNNPDPDKPNPNDPNTDGGGGSSEPTDGGGDGGDGGSINLKPVIDAITALKNALLSALSGISGKIDQLVNGQKQTNEKLDKSNEHLGKIQDATSATSEATGDIRDFLKDDKKPPENDTTVPVEKVQVPEPTNQNYLGWSPSCPMQAKSNELVINGIAVAIESDFTPTCEMALAVRPFVLAAGAIFAFLIASGVWMGRGDN